jgi:hypothetical protein
MRRSLFPMTTTQLVLIACAGAVLAVTPDAGAQSLAPADSAATDSARLKAPPRIYYGGGIGFSISSRYTTISLQPHAGYKLTPKTSIGASLRYEYFKDSRIVPTAESHSYGAGVFSRHRFSRNVYGQAELAFTQYDWNDTRGDYSVPYFLLGVGWAQPIAPRTWLTVDVMYDLIQDENSPYLDGSPRITTGISANF